MKIVILGASGATGKLLVAQALEGGHFVTAFVRTPSKLEIRHIALEVAQGDVKDLAALERALAGSDVVLSALGVGRPLRHDPAVIEGIRNVTRVMEQRGPARLIYQSFLGVRESRAQVGFVLGRIMATLVVRNEVADHEAKEAIIRKSKLDWTIVRPAGLSNGPHTGIYRHGVDIRARSLIPTISRADVAEFMLSQLTDRTYVRKAVAVMH